MATETTHYNAEAHRSAFQQLLTRMLSEDVMVHVEETSPFWLGFADVTDDGELPLRLVDGQLQAQFRGEQWCNVRDITIARYA